MDLARLGRSKEAVDRGLGLPVPRFFFLSALAAALGSIREASG
jgi:hypothetical protein